LHSTKWRDGNKKKDGNYSSQKIIQYRIQWAMKMDTQFMTSTKK
jgi:hypothetical protein